YQMQLRARLRELHKLTAEAMEMLYTETLAEKYADLAFHYEHAEESDKAIEYLQKAADEAKSRYQNQQAITLYDRLLAQVHDVFGFEEIEIDALLGKAEILELIGEWEECQYICEEAFQLAEQIDDKGRMGYATLTLEMLCRNTGKHDKAMMYFEQATELFETVSERIGIGHASRIMGLVHWQKNDYELALKCYEKALNIYEELGDSPSISITTNNIGILYTELRVDYDAAMTWYNKSLQISKKLGIKPSMSKVLNNIGECHRSQGHHEEAMAHYEQTLTISEELGDKLQMSTTLGNIGLVHNARGDYDKALASYDRAITLGRELESKYYLCTYLIDKADALFSLQRYDEAQTLNREGLHIAREIEEKNDIFKGTVLSVKIAFALGSKDAPRRFNEMLQQAEDDAEIATLHYEIWKMTDNEKHRRAALNLYQGLYTTTPNINYKTRIEKMENYKD
ncbi:MAG: tetratricopeptide repeat protein, partial [bacterium]|nr:tetratricopeptide repeat protein [bacterium]